MRVFLKDVTSQDRSEFHDALVTSDLDHQERAADSSQGESGQAKGL